LEGVLELKPSTCILFTQSCGVQLLSFRREIHFE
jgi:hypothetical protein